MALRDVVQSPVLVMTCMVCVCVRVCVCVCMYVYVCLCVGNDGIAISIGSMSCTESKVNKITVADCEGSHLPRGHTLAPLQLWETLRNIHQLHST